MFCLSGDVGFFVGVVMLFEVMLFFLILFLDIVGGVVFVGCFGLFLELLGVLMVFVMVFSREGGVFWNWLMLKLVVMCMGFVICVVKFVVSVFCVLN